MPFGETFESTLDAARVGADWAWARIYREMAPAVLGYLRAQRTAEPEDLAAEVFIQLVRDMQRFDGDERGFRAWIFTVAHNRMIDDARRRGRRIVSIALDHESVELAGPVGDAEEEALGRLSAAEVVRILDDLSPDQRAVMLLRILADLSIAEIAVALGKTEGAVKQLQHRASSAIRRAFSPEGVTP